MTSTSAPRLLSVIMPVYNEGATIGSVLKALDAVAVPIPWELIIVDDGSTDGSTDHVSRADVRNATDVTIVRARSNRGKGSALRKGFSLARGDILTIQDADAEYDPSEIPRLLAPVLSGDADVVFGTREFGAHSSFSFWYVMGNRALSTAASAIFNRYITDAYTCYKLFTRDVYERCHLTSNGFEIEAEMTGEFLAAGARVFEVPIRYVARSREEGKKIRAKDGLRGFVMLLQVRLRRRGRRTAGG